ncbi:hypothetical protein [Jiangella rhizosphaerae]|uniref:Uncharacterized protein n=1 Tax=Jiangella rhizosphaerae TaxID=2293569 RepID=A0A418KQE7_9ACTN|nr:hypothetical protein [Jiangella rhizosphaerae]RIQ21818.1 hypothetical protein DY240_14760 [Jiangella rhizosphaerae]
MTGRFDRPGLLATVTGAAVLDGTPQVIRNVVTHATVRRAVPAARRHRMAALAQGASSEAPAGATEPAPENSAARSLVAAWAGGD